MKADPVIICLPSACPMRAKTSDYLELTKPKLTLLVLFTCFVGFCAGSQGSISWLLLLHTLVGTALMSGGAGAFNMYAEKNTDALMRRTALRPIASGRLRSVQALSFALLISAGGLVYLYVFVNGLTTILSAFIFAGYVFLYTPLKTKTWLSTLVGAVPGALPVIMGWTAATQTFSPGAAVLFAIVFLWQMPHFYAIGWMYREEYAKAGIPVLSVIDRSGHRTGRQAVSFIGLLFIVSLLPPIVGMAGIAYPIGAILFGAIFLAYGITFARRRNHVSARRLFLVSALYLPALFVFLVLDQLAIR